MATAAILENRKIAISRPRFDRIQPNLARPRISTILSCPTVKFKIFKIQDGGGRHLGKSKTRYISAAVCAISTRLTQFDPLDAFDR